MILEIYCKRLEVFDILSYDMLFVISFQFSLTLFGAFCRDKYFISIKMNIMLVFLELIFNYCIALSQGLYNEFSFIHMRVIDHLFISKRVAFS